MKSLIQVELARSFHRVWFWIVILIGAGIAIGYFVTDVYPGAYGMLVIPESFQEKIRLFPGSPYMNWLGMSYSPWNYYYYFILPILAVLPFGDTLFTDLTRGITVGYCVKSKTRNQVFLAKYISAFLSGGIGAAFPLALSFLLSCTVSPLLNPELSLYTSLMGELSSFPDLYLTAPFLFVLLYLFFAFIFGGLYAVFGLSSSFFLSHQFLVLLSPFVLHLLLLTVFPMIGMKEWVPMRFLNPSNPEDMIVPLIVEGLVLFVLTFWIVVIRTRKRDIF